MFDFYQFTDTNSLNKISRNIDAHVTAIEPPGEEGLTAQQHSQKEESDQEVKKRGIKELENRTRMIRPRD